MFRIKFEQLFQRLYLRTTREMAYDVYMFGCAGLGAGVSRSNHSPIQKRSLIYHSALGCSTGMLLGVIYPIILPMSIIAYAAVTIDKNIRG
jgi:hypothetical protein